MNRIKLKQESSSGFDKIQTAGMFVIGSAFIYSGITTEKIIGGYILTIIGAIPILAYLYAALASQHLDIGPDELVITNKYLTHKRLQRFPYQEIGNLKFEKNVKWEDIYPESGVDEYVVRSEHENHAEIITFWYMEEKIVIGEHCRPYGGQEVYETIKQKVEEKDKLYL